MTVKYRCPECGHVFKPSRVADWDKIEILENDCVYYHYGTISCECGRQLAFTAVYEPIDVDVEVVG